MASTLRLDYYIYSSRVNFSAASFPFKDLPAWKCYIDGGSTPSPHFSVLYFLAGS